MPDASATTTKRVLIVDRSQDSRDVLRTVLERRGVQILETGEPSQGLEFTRKYRPQVVVLDLDVGAESPGLEDAYGRETTAIASHLVILGNVRQMPCAAGRHVVHKPYHYGPLIRKIEQLADPVDEMC